MKSPFGGIFKKWFHNGSRKQAARIRLVVAARAQEERQRLYDLNNPQGPLALDRDGDGVIDPATDLGFVDEAIGATTDLDGLFAFDANGDGKLDATDPQWQRFGLWNDTNKDGKFQAGEFKSLDAMGVASINLDASDVDSRLDVTFTDGRSGTIALASLLQN